MEEKEIYEVLKRITKQLEKHETEASEDADRNKGFNDEMASFYRGKETALVYARNLIEVTFEKALKGE